MSNTKFTPGPWVYKQYQKGVWGVGDPNTNDQIAKLEWNKEYDSEAGANAALIAAAPELYEALGNLLLEYSAISDSGNANHKNEIAAANRVLAKARGENTIDP